MIHKISKIHIIYVTAIIFIIFGLLNFLPKNDGYGTDGDDVCIGIHKISISKTGEKSDDTISESSAKIMADWASSFMHEHKGIMTESTEKITSWSLREYRKGSSPERTPDSIMLECRKIFGTIKSDAEYNQVKASLTAIPLDEKIMAKIYGAGGAKYGAYDSNNQCWIADDEGYGYCMKVGKLAYDSSSKLYNFLAIGSAYDKDTKKLDGAHSRLGIIEVFVISEKASAISVISSGRGYMSGSFGLPEDTWSLERVGDNTWGWIMPHKNSIPDYQESYYRVLTPAGSSFTESLILSGMYRFDVAEGCSHDCDPVNTDISSKISFDKSKSTNGIYDAIITIDSSEPDAYLKGTTIRYTWGSEGYKEPSDSILLKIKSRPDTWPILDDL